MVNQRRISIIKFIHEPCDRVFQRFRYCGRSDSEHFGNFSVAQSLSTEVKTLALPLGQFSNCFHEQPESLFVLIKFFRVGNPLPFGGTDCVLLLKDGNNPPLPLLQIEGQISRYTE